jgi:hypothetical protein
MITYKSTTEKTEFETFSEAVEYAKTMHAVVEEFADRFICWDSEEDAENDDGSKAVAVIR